MNLNVIWTFLIIRFFWGESKLGNLYQFIDVWDNHRMNPSLFTGLLNIVDVEGALI